MRALVTGATGLIGLPATRMLAAAGHRVRVLARAGTQTAARSTGAAEVVVGGLEDAAGLRNATRGIDVVIHLAGLMPPSPPADMTNVNERGTTLLLDACIASRVGRFVFASSTSVYRATSDPRSRNIDESSPLRRDARTAIEYYGLTKARAEQLMRSARSRHGPAYGILRCPMVYGSADRWDRQLVDLLPLPWNVLPARAAVPNMQWVHVDDVARAILLAATHAGAVDCAFNIAGNQLFSIAEVAQVLQRLEGTPAARRGSVRDGIPARPLKYEIGLARQRIGFEPRVSLAQGLRAMLIEGPSLRGGAPRQAMFA